MSDLSATTELEAVNTMLSCISESPVDSLEVSGLATVAIAKAVLNETSRNVQEVGWHFNQEDDYPLLRASDGTITLPSNVAGVDTSGVDADIDVTMRGLRLYDRGEHTYEFTKDLTVDITWFLPWDELPQSARNYICIRAARIFQARQLGSETKHKFSGPEESSALAALERRDINSSDDNMLNGSWSVFNILDR